MSSSQNAHIGLDDMVRAYHKAAEVSDVKIIHSILVLADQMGVDFTASAQLDSPYSASGSPSLH